MSYYSCASVLLKIIIADPLIWIDSDSLHISAYQGNNINTYTDVEVICKYGLVRPRDTS
jgi:hypothetical protein